MEIINHCPQLQYKTDFNLEPISLTLSPHEKGQYKFSETGSWDTNVPPIKIILISRDNNNIVENIWQKAINTIPLNIFYKTGDLGGFTKSNGLDIISLLIVNRAQQAEFVSVKVSVLSVINLIMTKILQSADLFRVPKNMDKEINQKSIAENPIDQVNPENINNSNISENSGVKCDETCEKLVEIKPGNDNKVFGSIYVSTEVLENLQRDGLSEIFMCSAFNNLLFANF